MKRLARISLLAIFLLSYLLQSVIQKLSDRGIETRHGPSFEKEDTLSNQFTGIQTLFTL